MLRKLKIGNHGFVPIDEFDVYSWTAHDRIDHVSTSFDDRVFTDRAFSLRDVAANARTNASVPVGGTYIGNIDFSGDVDWIKVSLTAGKTYTISEIGSANGGAGTLADPSIIGIYNSSSSLVAAGNNDFGGSVNACVEFTPSKTGLYFIAAGASGSVTGSYAVKVMEKDITAPTLISANPADEAGQVAVGSNFSFQFSENIQIGSGTISISDGTTNHVLSGSEISVSGSVVTINPAADLAANTDYTLTISSGAIKDVAGNAYAGLSTYNFHTEASSVSSGTWNIMLYVAADNDLEPYALWNLNQVESVSLPNNVKITALVDRSPSYSRASGNWSDTRFGFIEKDTYLSTVTSLSTPGTEKNMGDPTTLTNFIQNASSLYPADHNILVIWDHGDGLNGAAWDYTNNYDHLTVSEMSTAIAASGIHFDIIGFDACLMATVEVAYQLSSYCDYYVGSQDLEPGNGWAYDSWLNLFTSTPNPTAEAVADRAVTTYAAQYPRMSGIELSSLDMAAMPQLTNALKAFSDFAVTASSTDLAAISAAAQAAQNYPVGSADPNVDIGNFMQRVYAATSASATLKTDAANVLTALQSLIVSEAGTVAASTGLSIYLPAGFDTVDSSYNALNYQFLVGVPNWDNMLALI